MKDLVEKYFGTRRIKLTGVPKNGEKKMVFTSRKSVSSTTNKLLALAVMFFKIEFHLISIMVSTTRRKALKSVSISRNNFY